MVERMVPREPLGDGGHVPMKKMFKDYVNIDICEEHRGVWLDGGELRAMKHLDSSPVLLGDEKN